MADTHREDTIQILLYDFVVSEIKQKSAYEKRRNDVLQFNRVPFNAFVCLPFHFPAYDFNSLVSLPCSSEYNTYSVLLIISNDV